jgi:hypothetical protein
MLVRAGDTVLGTHTLIRGHDTILGTHTVDPLSSTVHLRIEA